MAAPSDAMAGVATVVVVNANVTARSVVEMAREKALLLLSPGERLAANCVLCTMTCG